MSQHVFKIENIDNKYTVDKIKQLIMNISDVSHVEISINNKTIHITGGDSDVIERKLLMNSYQIEKIEASEPTKKKTIFKKKEIEKPQLTENKKLLEEENTQNPQTITTPEQKIIEEKKLQQQNSSKNKDDSQINQSKSKKNKSLFKKMLGKS